jgi:hypothetical protein
MRASARDLSLCCYEQRLTFDCALSHASRNAVLGRTSDSSSNARIGYPWALNITSNPHLC